MSEEIQSTIEAVSDDVPASRARQMIVTLVLCAGGVAVDIWGDLSWQLVTLLVVGVLAYTAKSVLKTAVERLPLPGFLGGGKS